VSDYTVAIDTISISGDVLLGEERLQRAKLLFGGAGGAEKVRAAADEQGHFNVVLPRRGTWMVEVEASEEDVFASTKVEVPPDAERVDIKLPDTEVSGWVVGTNGERLSSAEVLLLLPNSARPRRTDNAGNFAFRGVAGGTVRLQATNAATREASTVAEVVVPSAGKVSNIALTIEGLRSVAGIVRAGSAWASVVSPRD
jgi:hypothetical protein